MEMVVMLIFKCAFLCQYEFCPTVQCYTISTTTIIIGHNERPFIVELTYSRLTPLFQALVFVQCKSQCVLSFSYLQH